MAKSKVSKSYVEPSYTIKPLIKEFEEISVEFNTTDTTKETLLKYFANEEIEEEFKQFYLLHSSFLNDKQKQITYVRQFIVNRLLFMFYKESYEVLTDLIRSDVALTDYRHILIDQLLLCNDFAGVKFVMTLEIVGWGQPSYHQLRQNIQYYVERIDGDQPSQSPYLDLFMFFADIDVEWLKECFYSALAQNNLYLIKYCIEDKNLDLDPPSDDSYWYSDSRIYKCLEEPLKSNRIDIVNYLIKAGANTDKHIQHGYNISTKMGNISYMKMFIDLGAEYLDSLETALYHNHPSAVKFLLESDAKHPSHIQDFIKRDHVECLKLLISHGLNIKDHILKSTLFRVGMSQSIPIIKLFIDAEVDMFTDGSFMEGFTSRSSFDDTHMEVIRFVVNIGGDIHYKQDTILKQAVASNNIVVTEELLSKYQCDLTIGGEVCLEDAINNRNTEMIELLVKYGLDPSTNSNYGIKECVRRNNYQSVVFFLKDCSIDANVEDGCLVKMTIELNNFPMLRLLIDHGGNYEQFRDIAFKRYETLTEKSKNTEKTKKYLNSLYCFE